MFRIHEKAHKILVSEAVCVSGYISACNTLREWIFMKFDIEEFF